MPLRPLGFGDLLGLPFRAMRFNRGVVVGGPLLFTLGATALLTLAAWFAFEDASMLFFDVGGTGGTTLGSDTVALLIAAGVMMLLADVLASAIVAPAVARGILGERITLGDAWKAVRPRIGSLLLLYLYAFLASVVALLLGFLVAALVGSLDSVGAAILAVIIVVLVYIAVAVTVMLIGGVARPVVVLEQRSAGKAIARAMRLLKGRYWWSVLVLLVASVLIFVVSMVIGQVGNFASLALTFAAPDSAVVLGIAFVLTMVVSLVVSYVLTYSYLGSLFALLLVDLRIRHEGFDLTLAEAAEARRA
ncbi:hypothetical protein [Demequina subtropica]|uniref:hypothetical protein n=1 Tax=Demequina subtropica TaxID=1638989 RepID=UPI0007838189|nr:hypothetical protein [Demequina subtropica]